MASSQLNTRVNGNRLWDSLMEMAKIGALPNGGSSRLALTDEDKAGRDLFISWCRDANCTIELDDMGNIFARRKGLQDHLPPVMIGSHLDTQPHGGKFDGVYGVLAGLEVIRSLNDAELETDCPIEIAVWTNEEGARFAPAMLSSAVFAGLFDRDYAYQRSDMDGYKLGDELNRIGYQGEQPCGNRKLDAFFEAHIEQGPILEDSECTIGVVLGGQGQQWYDLSITGQDAHSGSTPMPNRKDALVAAADIIKAVREVAKAHAPHGVGTVGHAEIMPNSRNTIPGVVRLTVDLRHPDDKTLLAMGEMFLSECNNAKHSEGVELTIEKILERPSVNFDKDCIRMVRESAEALGYSHQEIYSGAGHDACNISLTAPTTMIFIPCAGGLSHNEAESATPEDVEAGCNVLLHSILGRANKAPAMPSEP